MSCCGGKREALRETPPVSPIPGAAPLRPTRTYTVYFEYLGSTGMTVLGPVTGKRYRFNGRGARVEIDLRDRPGLAAVPHLRQV